VKKAAMTGFDLAQESSQMAYQSELRQSKLVENYIVTICIAT
jgi:hypothetical protein